MDKAFKSIKHGLEKDIKQYSHNMDKGLQLTDKDPERLFHLMGAMAFAKLLCMLEEMKEGGEKEGKGGMGGMLHAMGKQIGGGSQGGMQAMMSAIGLPHIPGFTGSGIYPQQPPMGYPAEDRRGTPGSGRTRYEYDNAYGDYENDMENRRGRSSRTGRFVHRSEGGEGMTDTYDNMNMTGGQGGSSGGSGGQSGGNTGGGRR